MTIPHTRIPEYIAATTPRKRSNFNRLEWRAIIIAACVLLVAALLACI